MHLLDVVALLSRADTCLDVSTALPCLDGFGEEPLSSHIGCGLIHPATVQHLPELGVVSTESRTVSGTNELAI